MSVILKGEKGEAVRRGLCSCDYKGTQHPEMKGFETEVKLKVVETEDFYSTCSPCCHFL